TVLNDRVSGNDFLSALEDLLVSANKCKSEADHIKEEYTIIYKNLNEISDVLQDYENYLQNEVMKGVKDAEYYLDKKIDAKVGKWASIIAGTGFTALAPFTAGISLLGTAIMAQIASESANKEQRYREARIKARQLVSNSNNVRGLVQDIITQTDSIIKILNAFQVFWDSRVNEIQNLIEEFEDKRQATLSYNLFSANQAIKKWNK
ncbi:17118_t:CDS:1, partial [Racocetra fulgida]